MRVLDVLLHGNLIGHISETRKGGRFAYSAEATTAARASSHAALRTSTF